VFARTRAMVWTRAWSSPSVVGSGGVSFVVASCLLLFRVRVFLVSTRFTRCAAPCICPYFREPVSLAFSARLTRQNDSSQK